MEDVFTQSRVIIENGVIKPIFSDEVERTGYMPVEEMGYLLHEMVKQVYQNDMQ
jgi:hypothetical protein